jgi:hypothetical protein
VCGQGDGDAMTEERANVMPESSASRPLWRYLPFLVCMFLPPLLLVGFVGEMQWVSNKLGGLYVLHDGHFEKIAESKLIRNMVLSIGTWSIGVSLACVGLTIALWRGRRVSAELLRQQ